MNLKELDSFKLSDAVTFHDKLNPKLWNSTKLRPDVRERLLIIAQDFLQELGVHDLDVKDITISGSNAAFSYTKHSDLDLHILVDMGNLPVDEVYRELFTAKKTIYNDTHDIKINTIPVELYVQDSRQPVVSLGEYSVMNDQWIKIPTKRRSDFDQTATKSKYEKLLGLIEIALKSKKYSKVKHIIDTIKRYRQAGLDKGGEFGPENLAYKMLRSQGYITKLYELRDKLHSEKLSFETMYRNVTDEDYDPNGIPPGPETKPTMPRGTVRVDVSDVYDWYKLGQNISNLDRVDPKIFGKGPPSTIVSFGDEDTEHKYINALKNLGLSTTDIDPVDPNQPKSMPRQKVDPTYNVNETTDQEIHNYSKLDNILEKLCNMVVKGQQKDSKYYGMVAAAVLDPDNNIVAGVNRFASDNKRVHAERVAIEKYENKYGTVPEGSIVITTLSPCSESDDETAMGRVGESCTDYLNSKGIEKVYCGYVDPTQDNDNREFNIMETSDKAIRHKCKQFADTFLKSGVEENYTMQFASEKTPVVSPYAGIKDNQYRGGISEAVVSNFVYHVTPTKNLKSIVKQGLVPTIGDRSSQIAGEKSGIYVFPDRASAEDAVMNWLGDEFDDEPLTMLKIDVSGLDKHITKGADYELIVGTTIEPSRIKRVNVQLEEASGYIPSEKEKNDPRFKTALTVDINPYTMKKGAKQFGWNISRAGIPPTANPNGKI
jgi:pyrimidine deaminase RibD-like protein